MAASGKKAKKMGPEPSAPRLRGPLPGKRFGRREDLGLTPREYAILRRLDTPPKIQAFLNGIPCNHEIGGETVLSVREVLRQRRAHCIEGAMVAAAALWVNGRTPLVLHLDCDLSDYPHVVTIFRQHGAWGAISKTNGTPLRYRDPIYRSLRELALSYFHEYSNRRGHKTLRSYSLPFDMRRIAPEEWVTAKKSCWTTHDRITAQRHFALISRSQERLLAPRDPFERKASKIVQYPRPELG
jgi:hypothetical protein